MTFTRDIPIPDSISGRNRVLLERTKQLGDAVYSESMRLIIRPNVDAKRTDRWGFDVVQSSAWYAVALARWCTERPNQSRAERDRLNDILQRMCQKQDCDPESKTYGNIIWNWSWTEVKDRNGVSFWSPEIGYIFSHHRDLLTDETRRILADTLTRCIDGLDRHRPRWQYTNIFLLNILSRLSIAHALDRPDVLSQAETDWHLWFSETNRGGLTEYNSPTYIVTALAPLARMLPLCPNAAMRTQIETVLEYLYADFCWHYHPSLHLLAGATSRSYSGDWQNNSLTNLIAYQQFKAPLQAVNLVGSFVALSEYEASQANIRRATNAKRGIAVRAAIPENRIGRVTYFGEHFALGMKSGASYGPQELMMTLAYPGRHQRMAILKHQPETRAVAYGDIQNGTGLLGIAYRNPPETGGSPHNWTRLIFGPPDHFTSITANAQPWTGDYCPISNGASLSVQTDCVNMNFRFGFFSLSQGEPGIVAYLWHQYEDDLVVLEFVAWQPVLAALAVGISESGQGEMPSPVQFRNGNLSSGSIAVPIPDRDDAPMNAGLPLLDAPDITWQPGTWT